MKIDDDGRIRSKCLSDQEIPVGSGGALALLDCELVNCTVTVDDLHIPLFRCKLVDCTLVLKRALKNTRAFNCRYERCTFKGLCTGVDFGRDPHIDPISKTYDTLGEFIDCDFTHAKLDLCRFFSVDIHRQAFAPWPQFVVPHARELAASNLERQWPGEFKNYLDLAKDENPKLSATTGTVDYFCHNKKKNRGFALTEAELRQALLDVGGVVM